MIGSGNNQKALNKDRVENLLYPLFPLTEQMEILNRIESRLAICDKLEDTIEQSLKQSEVLRQSLLKKAFEGDFVPQDSNDEPVEKLIERIRLSKIEKLTQYKVNKRRGKNER
jgi:type I restriction enzyme S subunit